MENIIQFRRKERESAFELIRILAQWFIIVYHIYLFYIYPTTHNEIHKSIWLPLHIGVILFVFISGYFGIKPSVKGLIKLLGTAFIICFPMQLLNTYLLKIETPDVPGGSIISSLFIFSRSETWFIRTYIYLYLFAPVINTYLKNIDNKHRWYLLIVLGIINIYVGTVGNDPTVADGKNLSNFVFLYVVGDTLHRYRERWSTIRTKNILLTYITYNVVLVAFFSTFGGNLAVDVVFKRMFFSYCSIGLLVNAILFFMMIGKLHFKSKLVNTVAKASLIMYIFHGSAIVFIGLIKPTVFWFISQSDNEVVRFVYFSAIACVVMVASVFLDWALKPYYSLLDKIGGLLQSKIYALFGKVDRDM